MSVDGNQTYLGVGPDGRHQFQFRQSTVKNLDMCPERVRFEETHPEECFESDAAAIGTGVHAGIEMYLTGEVNSLAGMLDVMEMDFVAATEGPQFAWKRWTGGPQSVAAAIGFGSTCLGHWWEKYGETGYFDLEKVEIEKHFDIPFYEDDERVIRLSGTIDLVQHGLAYDEHTQWETVRPWDWKTGSREYQEYQYRRWAVQPTAYTKACSVLYPEAEIEDFTYAVMLPAKLQQFSVERGPADWNFLATKCVNYAKMMEANVWPTVDSHDLCSPKWAPCWDSCKGKEVRWA